MNYIGEIKAFEQWLETHYLPISSQLLWYKLMSLCNRAGWSEWVTVDNLRLMAAMQMSREATLIKARDELIKAGLMVYQKGKKGSPNRYHILSLCEKNTFKSEVQNVVEEAVQSEVQNVVEEAVQSVDIYKQNKTIKENQEKEKSEIDLPLKDGSAYAVSSEKVEEWERLYPAVNVRQELRAMYGWLDANKERRKTRKGTPRFIVGWLSRKQEALAIQPMKQKSNTFTDFEQRNYSSEFYQALEKQAIKR